MEYVFGSLGVYWIKKNEMKWVCGNMAAMRSLSSGWLWNTFFFLTKKNETSISFVTSFWNVFF